MHEWPDPENCSTLCASRLTVGAGRILDPERWREAFTSVLGRIESRFARYEPLRHAAGLL